MVHDKELLCGCIERRTNEGTTKLHECGRHKPLSFGGRVRNLCDPAFTPPKGYLAAAPSLEDTQPINGPSPVRGSGSTVAVEGYGERSALGMLGDVLFGKALPFALTVTDARGSHTLCEFTTQERAVLLELVLTERVRLLHERRVYVLARKGDLNRFSDLLAQIDQQLAGINPLCDKLKERP